MALAAADIAIDAGAHSLVEGGAPGHAALEAGSAGDEEELVAGAYFVDLGGCQGEGFVPRDLLPLAVDALGVGADDGRLEAIGVIQRGELGVALQAQAALIAHVRSIAPELHHLAVNNMGLHDAAMLANPAGGGEPLLFRRRGSGCGWLEQRQSRPTQSIAQGQDTGCRCRALQERSSRDRWSNNLVGHTSTSLIRLTP